ncbi:MAG: hypothetical protein M1812_007056 [Candelaria pacifica]|nr:MAG: hypothetical protein M1812_007056 [Candelaria pacifica]
MPSPKFQSSPALTTPHMSRPAVRSKRAPMAWRESRGKPLQYILGSQPFGDLDIICESGVLIPSGNRRPETEAYTDHLARGILDERRRSDSNPDRPLRILDLGTGTGCIPLLFHARLFKHIPNIHIVGIDINPKAIALALRNIQRNIFKGNLDTSASRQISFHLGDILEMSDKCKDSTAISPILGKDWDIVISNPPYISPEAFKTTTSRSVRIFEPKVALVPPSEHAIGIGGATRNGHVANEGDTLYPAILSIATKVNANQVVLEVSDLVQAARVTSIVLKTEQWDHVEIWRDSISNNRLQTSKGQVLPSQLVVGGHEVPVRGDGIGRVVVCWKDKCKER